MKTALPLLVLLVVTAFLALVYCDTKTVAPEEPPGTQTGQAERTPPKQGQPKEASADTSVPEREKMPAVPEAVPTSKVAVFRGRCVDTSGQPMAGVGASLSAWRGNRSRMENYLKDHDKVEWKNPTPQLTGADGKFEFRVVPPPPYQFTLDLTRSGYQELTGRWGSIPPESVKDFGDCTMIRGCVVEGRVMDESNLARTNVQVHLNRGDRSLMPDPKQLHPRRWASARTGADGAFRMGRLLGPGKWTFDIEHEQLISQEEIEVKAQDTELSFTLKVKSKANVPSIRGIVVDDQGQPVRGAQVEAESRRGGGWMQSSGRDGSFVFERNARDHNDKPVVLIADRRGYEYARTEKAWPWGSTGVRLVLRQGATMSVVVTDARSGKAVEDYGVRIQLHGNAWRRYSSADEGVRARGHHDDGRAEVEGLRRGEYLFRVEPKGKDLCSSVFRVVQVGDEHPKEIRFDLRPAAVRVLRVETAAAKPVAGTKVELLEPLYDVPVDLTTFAARYDGSSTSAKNQAVVWCEGTTSGNGEYALRGPGQQRLALRILGPGHIPKVVRDILLGSGSDPIVVKVAVGATVYGRIHPARLLEQMIAMAGKNRHALRNPPGLIFRQGTESFPTVYGKGLPIQKDGSFTCDGIGPGTWQILVVWQNAMGQTTSGARSLEIGTVPNLQDGERRKLDLDVSHLLFATLQGRALLNGKPHAGQVVFKSAGGDWDYAMADDKGRFVAHLRPGSYQARVASNVTNNYVTLQADETVVLTAGQELSMDLHATAITVRLQALGSDGKPRKDVVLMSQQENGGFAIDFHQSDKDGLVSAMLSPGTYPLRIWPESLASQDARSKFQAQHQGDPGALWRQRITLDPLEVKPGGGLVKIKLPAASGY